MAIAAIPPEISAGHRIAIHAALLFASLIIYSIFRAMWRTPSVPGQVHFVQGSILGSFILLSVLSALAFGTAAWFEPHWRSRDAARVATLVWLIASVFYYLAFGCPKILLFIVIPFFPFCLGALIGHNVGRLHFPAHWDAVEMNFDD